MKLKEEQKDVIKAVSKKVGEQFSEDIRKTDPNTIKRPMVMLVLVVALVGVVRDPMTLLLGIVAAIIVALIMSTSSEDLQKFLAAMKKDEKKEGEQAAAEVVSEKAEVQSEEEKK